jgi:hypothetical protein
VRRSPATAGQTVRTLWLTFALSAVHLPCTVMPWLHHHVYTPPGSHHAPAQHRPRFTHGTGSGAQTRVVHLSVQCACRCMRPSVSVWCSAGSMVHGSCMVRCCHDCRCTALRPSMHAVAAYAVISLILTAASKVVKGNHPMANSLQVQSEQANHSIKLQAVRVPPSHVTPTW